MYNIQLGAQMRPKRFQHLAKNDQSFWSKERFLKKYSNIQKIFETTLRLILLQLELVTKVTFFNKMPKSGKEKGLGFKTFYKYCYQKYRGKSKSNVSPHLAEVRNFKN